MKPIILEARDITKSFGRKVVLHEVNLRMEKGQSIALLGNNGTGKSTLLRILCGLANPTKGKVITQGQIKFHYIPEHFPKLNFTAAEYIKHMGRLEGLSEQETKEKSEEIYQEFSMESMLDTPIKHLSKGTLQKVAVIQALLSKPDILLMDEPLSGQDMQSQQNFIKRIKELKQQGVSILMSCHEKFLVNQLSDIAYRIEKGKLIAEKIEDARCSEYDLLTFQKGKSSESVPQNLHSLLVRVEEKDNFIKIVIQNERSNRIVKDMLAEGFILKEMRGMSE